MKHTFRRIATAALGAATLASVLSFSAANAVAAEGESQFLHPVISPEIAYEDFLWRSGQMPAVSVPFAPTPIGYVVDPNLHPVDSLEVAIEHQKWQSERALDPNDPEVQAQLWENAPNNPKNLPNGSGSVTDTVGGSSMQKVLPKSVDLSAHAAFPKVQDQGNTGACAAFSVVYYQFTYHVNKMNGISSSVLENCYSPAWVYYLNENETLDTYGNLEFEGMVPKNAYNFTMEHGAVKWNELAPQQTFDRSHPVPSKDAVLAALGTRIKAVTTLKVPYRTDSGVIKNVIGSSELNEMKKWLSEGYVLRVSSYSVALDPYYDQYDIVNSQGQHYIPRFYCDPNLKNDNGSVNKRGTATHSYCVVGYDDNFWGDINGNGKKDANETGAFKIVNSWGTDWHNDGYSWVMYDALNERSFVSGNWETNKPGTRYPAFLDKTEEGKYNNYYDCIVVENCKNYFVAQTSYTNVARCYETGYVEVSNTSNGQSRNSNMGVAYKGVKTFDAFMPYGSLASDIELIMFRPTTFKVRRNSLVSSTRFSAKLVDNKGNVISNMTEGDLVYVYSTPELQIKLGDVNYDSSLNAKDITAIQRLILTPANASDLQWYLADYNGDGSVNAKDITALMRAMQG